MEEVVRSNINVADAIDFLAIACERLTTEDIELSLALRKVVDALLINDTTVINEIVSKLNTIKVNPY